MSDTCPFCGAAFYDEGTVFIQYHCGQVILKGDTTKLGRCSECYEAEIAELRRWSACDLMGWHMINETASPGEVYLDKDNELYT